ncbi:MAG TPA: apolipoprotein N-acyltransferase [Desulfobacterales bacterium]|nr:apolipoprotein N-acyltransferase [Desulfobacterales bacterium]
MTFSLPDFDYGILAWFGLAPFLFVLRQGSVIAGAVFGFIFGYFYGLGTFYWLPLTEDVSFPQFLFLILPAFSLYYLSFGLLYRLIRPTTGPWIIVGAPALWVALEYARSNLFFLSMPWNLIAHSQYRYLPVIQIADITGVYGISFLIVMANQFWSQMPDLFARRRLAPAAFNGRAKGTNWTARFLPLVLVMGFTLFYGRHKLAAPDSSEHLRVALVQANVLARDNMPIAEQKEHLMAYQRLTREVASEKPALIVWPAASLPAQFRFRVVRRAVREIAREAGTYLLVGGAGVEKFKPKKDGQVSYSNSEFLIAGTGRLKKRYNKIRLVPFNEYLPLKGKLTWPRWITTLKKSFVPGKAYTLFEVSGVRFGTPICWENMFPDLFRRFVRDGAQFMVSVTNEGFFGRTAAPYQTLAMNVFRAVENHVAIVRVATTGVSCNINPSGKIVERVRDSDGNDLFVSGTLVRDVPLFKAKTFYTMHGDIFAFAATGASSLFFLISLYSRWRLRFRLRA